MGIKELREKLDNYVANGLITRTMAEQFNDALDGGDELGSLARLISRYNPRPITGLSKFPTVRATNELANSYYIRGGSHIIDTSSVNLANRVQEYGETAGPGGGVDMEEGFYGKYREKAWAIEGIISFDGIKQTGAPAGDCYLGYEVGSLNSDTPFSNTPSGGGCIQVRFNRTVNKIQLYTCRGDGSKAGASLNLSLIGTLSPDYYNLGVRTRLEYRSNPVSVKLSIYDNFDGQIKSVEQTDANKLPDPQGWAYLNGFAFFITTGSGAAGNQFSASDFWIYTKGDSVGELGEFSYM